MLAEIEAGRERIVECGSGLSTIAIGRLLAQRDEGFLHSLEHDSRWLADTAARLELEGADERVELHEAPLCRQRFGEWYDERAIAALPDRVDLLLVDGPPAHVHPSGEARYPALPALSERLADGALVILDDIHREGERRILERWEREMPIRFDRCARERLAIGVFSGAEMADSAIALERER